MDGEPAGYMVVLINRLMDDRMIDWMSNGLSFDRLVAAPFPLWLPHLKSAKFTE